MMLQLCTMPTVHYDNAVWVPMPIIHPKNWLLVVENSRLFAQRAHSARCAPQVRATEGQTWSSACTLPANQQTDQRGALFARIKTHLQPQIVAVVIAM